MRVGSLFAGIGGFDLAAKSLGWSTAWVSEIDPFASAVLAKHFPHAPNLGDITTVDWSTVERPDILCGGFPCQPHSLAGKRGSHADERDLWSQCVRAIRGLRPRYCVFENVPGLLTSTYAEAVDGWITARASGFFGRVLRDLAEAGYDAEWEVLSAADCGAPHRRERVWIVATRLGDPPRRGRGAGSELEVRRTDGGCDGVGDADHAGREGLGRPLGVDGAEGRHAEGRHGAQASVRLRLPDWSDAIPYRGADGTVRLIPRGAVELGDPSSGRCGGEPRRGAGQESADGHGELPGREAEGSRPEPSLRALAHGLSDKLLRRDCGGEVEAWPTPRAAEGRGIGADPDHWDARQKAFAAKGQDLHLGLEVAANKMAGTGGSLWPVTESEVGRVAKLRAIGNAVVPAWVVAGPFALIQRLEAGRP